MTKPKKHRPKKRTPSVPRPTAQPRPRGGQTIRTPALEDAVIEWVSSGKTLRSFCRLPGKPSRRTIDSWREVDPVFDARFARAREDGHDELAEEALEIANTPKSGKIITQGPDGKKTVTEDMLGHRRLQIDTITKLLAKWNPKKYGEKVEVEHSGSIELADRIRKARERVAKR